MISIPLLTLLILILVPPLYHRFEHFNLHPSRHIPTQVKWTAQVALGSAAAANTVCRLISKHQQQQRTSGGALGMLYCTSLGVAGGAMSAGAMMRDGGWGPREWAWYEGVVGGFAEGAVGARGDGEGEGAGKGEEL